VREALFMALEPLRGLRVVDLYAGSGALGIEALSRGAARADFVEPDRDARRALESNLADLGLGDRAGVWPLELPRGLARLGGVLGEADLVLLDPPYGGGRSARGQATTPGRAPGPVPGPGRAPGAASLARATVEWLGSEGLLKAGSRVVAEHHARDELPGRTGALSRVRARRYGETVVTTYEAAPADAPQAARETRP